MKTSITKKEDNSGEVRNQGIWLAPEFQLALFALAHVLIFLVIFHTIYKIQYSATGLYFNYATDVLNGRLPYRDFTLEYPPFALLFFILPRLIAPVWSTFSAVYQAEVLLVDLIGIFLIYDIARRLGKEPWRLLAVYTLGVVAIGPIIGQQYDIFPAIITLASIYFFCVGKQKTSWAFLALGTMTKFYPAFLAPIFLIYYIRNHQYRQIWTGLITFAVVCLVIFLPFLIISPGSIWNLINYHAQRGIQIESTYSAVLLVASKLGLTLVMPVFNFGSWNLSGSLADTLARLSTYVLAICLLLSYGLIYRQMKPGENQFSRIGAYSLIVIGITLVTSKVFSPQYLIWLIPLIPLILNRWRFAVWVVLVCIGAFTFYIFPLNYLALLNFDSGLIAVLFLRDFFIILLVALAAFSLRRMKTQDPQTPD